jgi:hypothetical protein
LRTRVLAVRVPLAIRTDDLDSAERYARQRLALEERRDKRDQAEYGRALGALGWTLMWQDQWPEAERLARAQLETDSLNQVGPMEVGGKDLTLIVNILMLRGRYREALEYEEQNYDSARRRVGEQHVATASIRIIRALLWDRTGRLAEGEAEMREAVAQLAGAHRSIADNSFDPWNLGRLLLDRGKLSEAQPLLRRSYDTVRARFGNAAKATLFVERDLGAALVALGDSNAAEAVLAHTAETFSARPGERGIQLAETQVRLSELRHLQQRDEEAQTLARAALATLLDTLGAEHDETGRAHHALGMALLARGETAAAMTELKAALDNYEHLFGPEDARVMRYRFDWGTALAAARPAEAEPILRQAAEALARDSQDETATRTAAQAWLKAHPSRPTRALSSIGTDVVVTGAEGSASR